MYFLQIYSDQLYTWSDRHAQQARCRIEKTPHCPSASIAPAQGDPAGLPHRTVQTMWQTGMQVRRWPRSWPEILPFGELPWLAAANGLRAAGGLRPDSTVPCQLPPGTRDLRADLRDQPRTPAPPGGALNGRHERSAFHSPRIVRCGIGRRAPRQYA